VDAVLIPASSITPSLRWMYDLSFFSHALRILQINQYGFTEASPSAGVHFGDCPPALHAPDTTAGVHL
jgi:hypothetical protein